MNWDAITAVGSVVSTFAFVATAVFVAQQLKSLEKSRYHQITSDLYSTWGSREFMEAQLWLIHKLEETSWDAFITAHRSDYGEQAFHRVGSFYDRVGTLVRLRLVDDKEILSTIGPYAIAVWQKVEPLVHEARRQENSVLFDDFEKLLPACYECYVPNLEKGQTVKPFAGPRRPRLTTVQELKKRLDVGPPVTVLDVRQPAAAALDRRTIPGAIVMPPDSVPERWEELPKARDVVAFCA